MPVWSTTESVFRNLHGWLQFLLPYAALFGLAFYFFWDSRQVIQEAREFSISREWNATIAKLGVHPLYPPQEDFRVGDVYAVLVALDPINERWNDRAIIIGHVNLDNDILENQRRRSRPRQTGENPPDWYLESDSAEHIVLRSIVFPGFDSNFGSDHQANANLAAGSADARSSSNAAEQIQITNAMTYGADPVVSLARLMAFCRETGLCEKALLRRLFAHRFGSAIFPPSAEGAQVSIDVRVVTRVFLSDDLSLTANRGREATGRLAFGADSSQDGGAQNALMGGQAAAEMGHAVRQQGQIPRPVVFGYHRIAIAALE